MTTYAAGDLQTAEQPESPSDLLGYYGDLVSAEVQRTLHRDDGSELGDIVARYPAPSGQAAPPRAAARHV